VEQGSHHELLQRDGYYARLMHQQLEHSEGESSTLNKSL
jgi:hypothetical protein